MLFGGICPLVKESDERYIAFILLTVMRATAGLVDRGGDLPSSENCVETAARSEIA